MSMIPEVKKEVLREYHAALRDIQGLDAEPSRVYSGAEH